MKHDETQDEGDGNKNLSDREQDLTDRLDRKKNPLPENISEYVQKARDELKRYEEQKKFYEKRRKKRDCTLGLVDLLEEHDYPKEWLRLIVSRELEDYISPSYIEKILAEKYPHEKKKVKEESTGQLTEIPQNDDKIPIEVSTTGESVVGNDDDLRSANSYDTNHTSIEVPEGVRKFKTDLERQAEEGTRQIVKTLQKQNRDLQRKCYQLDQLAQEARYGKKIYSTTTRIKILIKTKS